MALSSSNSFRLRQEGEKISITNSFFLTSCIFQNFYTAFTLPPTPTPLLGVFQDKKAGYFEWQLITTPSPNPSNLMRQKPCVFPCLCECACAGFSVYLNTREVAFPSRAATMVCLPMLLFVSIFTFAYAVRCLSYARGFLSQLSLSSSHSHAFHSRTHACTHTVQRYSAHEYSAPAAIMGNPLIVSVPRWWLERRTKKTVEGRKWRQSARFRQWQPARLFLFYFIH